MQRRIAALCLLFVLLMSAAALAVEFKTKPKLAFYPLVARNVEAIAFTEAISTQLFNHIERSDFFEIVERKKVETALVQNAATLTAMSHDTLYTVATKAGFDVFIVGNVARADNAAVIDLQVVGSGSRNAYYTETVTVAEFELQKKLQQMADNIVAKVKAFNAAPPPLETKIGCPANLTITGTPDSIKLKWAPAESPQVIGYAVLRSNSPNGFFVQIATTTTPRYVDGNLKLNDTFYYKVKAISKSGIECELTPALVGKTSLAPLPPIFIDIKTDLSGATLNWYSRPYSGSDRNQMTSGFTVYRKAANEADYRPISTVDANTTSYLDADMNNGVLYSYALTAFNPDKVESELSSALEAKTAQAATNVKAVGEHRLVQLAWTPNDSKGVEGYSIYRSTPADQNFQRVAQLKGRGTRSFQDTGLDDGTTYWYRIAAMLDGGKETPKSDAVSATTRQRPATPAGLNATGNEPRRVTLAWQRPGAPEDRIKGYYLYRATKDGGEFERIAEISYGKTSYVDDREKGTQKGGSMLGSLLSDGTRPLADGATYHYRITCFNEAGSESLPSQTVSATTRSLLPPPRQLQATSGQAGKVTLNWQASPEFKEYEVYRGAVGQMEVIRLKVVKEPFYVDKDVEHGASYIYAVKGVDGDEIPSVITTSVTGATKPRPVVPQGVSLNEQDGRKVIQWQPNPEKDVVRYVVYKKNFVGMYQKEDTVFGTSLVVSGSKGTHEYRVAAQDAEGLESEKSEAVTVEVK